LIEVDN